MKISMKEYRSILLCALVLTVVACKSTELPIGNGEAPVSATPISLGDLGSRIEDLPELLELIRDKNPDKKKSASERLMELSRNHGDRISKPLITEVSRLCSFKEDPYRYNESSAAARLLANILAERKEVSALDTLVDCADFVNGPGGSSHNTYATVPAIISYGEKAIPTLKKKLTTGTPEIKCQVAGILSTFAERSVVSREKAEHMVNDVLKVEKDEDVKYCLEDTLRELAVAKR